MGDLATFVVAALLTLGVGAFVLCIVLGAWRHFTWSRRARHDR